jgi:hypothetical protein
MARLQRMVTQDMKKVVAKAACNPPGCEDGNTDGGGGGGGGGDGKGGAGSKQVGGPWVV